MGQALTGAALNGVLLCGALSPADFFLAHAFLLAIAFFGQRTSPYSAPLRILQCNWRQSVKNASFLLLLPALDTVTREMVPPEPR